jgi:hypothetical protein
MTHQTQSSGDAGERPASVGETRQMRGERSGNVPTDALPGLVFGILMILLTIVGVVALIAATTRTSG